MIYTIQVPSTDHKNIENWLKGKKITMPEVIGRVYETGDADYFITAEIMTNQRDIHYCLYWKDQVFQKIVHAPICYFNEFGITVMFEVDKSYE